MKMYRIFKGIEMVPFSRSPGYPGSHLVRVYCIEKCRVTLFTTSLVFTYITSVIIIYKMFPHFYKMHDHKYIKLLLILEINDTTVTYFVSSCLVE